MKNLKLAILAMLVLTAQATAGRFFVTDIDASGIWVEYTGTVTDDDSSALRTLMDEARGRTVFVTINSGGGSAYGGLQLFWTAEQYPNLVTIAGERYGAWSAAAMFWLGSPRDWFEGPEARVAFHQAYCDDSNPPGCDLSRFQIHLMEALEFAGYNSWHFNEHLNTVQATWGVSGWVCLRQDGWSFYHSEFQLTHTIDPTWVEVKP